MSIALFIYVAVISYSAAYTQSNNNLRSKRSEEYVPCETEWYYFREKCYRAWGRGQKTFERLNWEGALARCRSYGGDLASIQSQEEQDFIVSFLQLDVKSWVWIGLNDGHREGTFKWTDGSDLNYTNWHRGEPSGRGTGNEDEDCVHMIFEPENAVIGTWNDRACSVPETYICEKRPNPSKRSYNPMLCSSAEGGGWKFHNSCYHVVTEMKSWQDAEEYCKGNYGGHLVSILDTLEDLFLDYISADINTEMWIGIKIQNQMQQKWSSGWYVAYEDFNKEQSDFVEGTCAVRKKRKEWIKLPCTQQLPFICETSKESPILKLSPEGSHCPVEFDGWRDLGGEYCYYFETEKALSFYEALLDCKRRGGDMATLHSKEENDMLFSFVKYVKRSVFIGLIRRLEPEEEFIWTDGRALEFENWNINEPNNKIEKCTEVITHDNPRGKIFTWNDIGCDQKRGFICSAKKISPNSTFVEDSKCTIISNSTLVEEEHDMSLNSTLIEEEKYTFTPNSTLAEEENPALLPNSTFVEEEKHAFSQNSTLVEKEKHTNSPSSAFVEKDECASHGSVKALTVVTVCFFLVIILLNIVLYYVRPWGTVHRKTSKSTFRTSMSQNRPAVWSTAELPLKDNEMTILDL